MPTLILKTGREKSLQRRHPWVFSGAIARVEGAPEAGETVEVLAADGAWLARGAYSPESQIAVRVWTFDESESVTADLLQRRLARAAAVRADLGLASVTTAYRLVNAESDFLPALIVDRYGDWLVCQFLSAGAERWKGDIAAALSHLAPGASLYERSDVDVREKEGLPARTGVLAGRPPPERVEIIEHGARFWVDVARGHKTGFYLDQRENRTLVRAAASGREVLNGFAYTGAFGVAALLGGAAHVTQVDSSAAALELAQRNIEANGLAEGARAAQVEGDVFQVLRQYRDARRQFDLIVLDPPKFAESKHQ